MINNLLFVLKIDISYLIFYVVHLRWALTRWNLKGKIFLRRRMILSWSLVWVEGCLSCLQSLVRQFLCARFWWDHWWGVHWDSCKQGEEQASLRVVRRSSRMVVPRLLLHPIFWLIFLPKNIIGFKCLDWIRLIILGLLKSVILKWYVKL